MTRKLSFIFYSLLFLSSVHAVEDKKGFTLGLKALLSGSLTGPSINQTDKDYLGAQFMRGMLGFIVNGEAELTYVFDSKRFFNYENDSFFSGLGFAFSLGIGQGFSGQISGQYNELIKKNIEVYCKVVLSPVITFGTSLKTMLFRNRVAIGVGVLGRMLADPQPVYELYTNLTDEEAKQLHNNGKGPDFFPETGTLFIPESMMRKMNPLGLVVRTSVEYNQPVIDRMDITIGAFAAYTFYKPGYVVLPKKLSEAAIQNGKLKGFDVNFERDKINSFRMDSLDLGVSLGLLFKV